MKLRDLIAATALAGMTWACSETETSAPEGVEDAENESYGGANLKADSVYSECHMLEVLKSVNESGADIDMLKSLFAIPKERGFKIAETVDHEGRAICLTTTLEHAELKRDQIKAFGSDPRNLRCANSMFATIEPAEES